MILMVALLAACACAGPSGEEAPPAVQPEATSLFGEPLEPPELPEELRLERERQLGEAQAAYEAAPRDLDTIIWLGRRTAYLGGYREAVEIFGAGLEIHPDNPRLLRHRGHRFITLRSFDLAVADLERAARGIEGQPDRVEQDGLPNDRNLPRSTTQSNIWYHLGLAHYLLGNNDEAARCFGEGLKVSVNPDMLCATSHWLYMTLRRLDRDAEAAALLEPIDEQMDVIENQAYHELLLLYRGERDPDLLWKRAAEATNGVVTASLGYGLANLQFESGEAERGEQMLRAILRGPQWAAFGHIAAEADLKRLGEAYPEAVFAKVAE